MARLKFNIPFKNITLAAAGTEKAIVGFKAPAQQDVALIDFKVFPNGQSGDAKHLEARISLITVDSGTPSDVTEVKRDGRVAGAVQTTGRTYGALPTITANSDLWVGKIHPQGAILEDVEWKEITIARGTEAVLLVTVPTGGTVVDVTGQLGCEE